MKQTTCMLAIVAGMYACSSSTEEPTLLSQENAQSGVNYLQESPSTKLATFIEGYDLSYPDTVNWAVLDTSRCSFYVNSPTREDYRAVVYAPDGMHVKTIYETALRLGENEISFSPDMLKPGTYHYVLTKNIYQDTVQFCAFEISPIQGVDADSSDENTSE